MLKVAGNAPPSATHNFNVEDCEGLCAGVCAHNSFHSLSPSSLPPALRHTHPANTQTFFPQKVVRHLWVNLLWIYFNRIQKVVCKEKGKAPKKIP